MSYVRHPIGRIVAFTKSVIDVPFLELAEKIVDICYNRLRFPRGAHSSFDDINDKEIVPFYIEFVDPFIECLMSSVMESSSFC